MRRNGEPRAGVLAGMVLAVLVLAGCGFLPPPLGPSPTPTVLPSPLVAGDLPAISADGIAEHLAALEQIAGEHDGLRTAGTEGYDASVEYVAGVMAELGYEVSRPEVTFDAFRELPGGTISIADGPTFEAGPDFHAMIYSGGGEVSAEVATVGFPDSSGGSGRQGCSPDDFDAFPSGAVALVPPGNCFRRDVVLNAQEAGAVALVVAVPQWEPGQARRPTLLSADDIEIPALSAIGEVGDALREAAEADVEVTIDVVTQVEEVLVHNVIADSPGDGSRLAMLGAHLDSVHDGPGINDNGSGVAALLEIARALAGEDSGQLRFAFWAAEEFGLYGSRSYVAALDGSERDAIAGYLNLDMLGSVNGVPYVYDDSQAAAGSPEIADYLVASLRSTGAGAERLDLSRSSDHAPFVQAGIATGGIFSGATETKTGEQAALFGGLAGEPLDPCYHLACDTAANVDVEAVARLAASAAKAAMALAGGDLLP